MRIKVRSRTGNAVLGILGVVYVCAAIALLAYHVMQTWGAAGLIDRAVQVVLLGAAATGIFFITTAAQNLGLHFQHHHARHHREDAVTAR
jgi:peptidoglycan biosynthesis protein MviN/MurJ (putative lipid II flippase)